MQGKDFRNPAYRCFAIISAATVRSLQIIQSLKTEAKMTIYVLNVQIGSYDLSDCPFTKQGYDNER